MGRIEGVCELEVVEGVCKLRKGTRRIIKDWSASIRSLIERRWLEGEMHNFQWHVATNAQSVAHEIIICEIDSEWQHLMRSHYSFNAF